MADWFDTLRPVLSGLAGGAVVVLLARFGASAVPDRQGWRSIRPSAMHWVGVVLGGGLTALLLYVRLFVGSARADAEHQMRILTLLIVAFAFCTLVSVVQFRRVVRSGVQWRGTAMVFRDRAGRSVTRLMTEVAGMDRRWTGTVRIAFEDGSELKLDQYARGVPELWERIVEVNDG